MSSQERNSDMKAGRATGDKLETYCKTDETNQRNNTVEHKWEGGAE